LRLRKTHLIFATKRAPCAG